MRASEPGVGDCAGHVGVDVGGTKLVAGRIRSDGTVEDLVVRATPAPAAGAAALEDAVVDAVTEVCGGLVPETVGLAAAAFVDRDRQRAMFAPHLAWRGEPVAARLAERLAAPVLLENDATCAAWAEHRLGAAAGTASSITVTVGTGIGGGIVVDGTLLRGAGGMAGEFGHVRLDPTGPPCPCGGRGCWERYCSGPALVAAAQRHRDPGAGPVHGTEVTAAAQAGRTWALAAFEEVGAALGRGLAGLVNVLDPQVVVVGGGVGSVGELLLGPARTVLADEVVGAGHRELPLVLTARLGPTAGMVGASLLARTAG